MISDQWKLLAAARVAKLTPEQALATIQRINGTGYGYVVEQPEVAKLTGGAVSPSINLHVVRLLARRAGILSS